MIREDAETVWCQLTAEPPPTREDLVVGIEGGSYWNEFPADVHLSVSPRLSLYVIPRHAEKSAEFPIYKTPRIGWQWERLASSTQREVQIGRKKGLTIKSEVAVDAFLRVKKDFTA